MDSENQTVKEMDSEALRATKASPSPIDTKSSIAAKDELVTPAAIKQEQAPTPRLASPVGERRPSDTEAQVSKAITALKSESSMRMQSPLRESSVPVPTTELPSSSNPASNPRKRPAPGKTKKGTAMTMKKAPAAKKRRLEPKLARSRAGGKRTPGNSSPAPSARSFSMDGHVQTDDGASDDDAANARSPAPSSSGDEEGSANSDNDGDVYCICRRPDNGTFMIGCDGTCDDWFHGKCVGIPEANKNLIDKYICPNCTAAEKGMTSWKRMCRRPGCRQPARIGRSKTGVSNPTPSKYCSDECGVLYFRAMASKTRGSNDDHSSNVKSRSAARAKIAAKQDSLSVGARGGVLAAGEVRAILDASDNAESFHKLGQPPALPPTAVLSPPLTPENGENNKAASDKPGANDFAADLTKITSAKEEARFRHTLLKSRVKFVGMVKSAIPGHAAAQDIKVKEFCGYDRRLEWSEGEFWSWWEQQEGNESASGTKDIHGDTKMANGEANGDGATSTAKSVKPTEKFDDENEPIVCSRKRCLRHTDWPKLALDALRAEISDNSDRMRGLETEERKLREQALLRSVGGRKGTGWVEKHDAADAETVAAAQSVPSASKLETGYPAEVATLNGIAEPIVEDRTDLIGDVDMDGSENNTRPTAESSGSPADEGVASESLPPVVEGGIAV
ncbi:uncharacterized protein K489DRAFT_375699 [Dissoconium aciculare CBS 342.82]|uniref:PHD-type domain-containing protein n=1 Tax=Dissoconium aciculare CBS 342.82 TaxID=1314786 RepID=A0A6J3MI25_9PEZI|nr:uncharacterized protein K489DRAFT_375699 [Dissoconium aciculare CBS 342.82]KAF1827586.1 hypothetical protein K489DRAFT_375699 [Dissoconium aciculare CBS 342.82]